MDKMDKRWRMSTGYMMEKSGLWNWWNFNWADDWSLIPLALLTFTLGPLAIIQIVCAIVCAF